MGGIEMISQAGSRRRLGDLEGDRVARGEECVVRLEMIITRTLFVGGNTTEAEALLKIFRDILSLFHNKLAATEKLQRSLGTQITTFAPSQNDHL
jgi:DNA-binding ferritin-like protein (Dps family)